LTAGATPTEAEAEARAEAAREAERCYEGVFRASAGGFHWAAYGYLLSAQAAEKRAAGAGS
jgi:hypothetical protein